MKVSCTDTSYIRTCFHGYIGNLRVYLQSLHPKYHTDTGILHFLWPIYIGSLVKTCQQFNNYCYFLSIACRINQCFYHFRIFSQTIEGCLDTFYFFINRRFLQYTDIRIETMIRHMNKTIFPTNQLQHTNVTRKLIFQNRSPFRVFQIFPATVWKTHQVLMVMIFSTAQYCIQLIQIQLVHDTF